MALTIARKGLTLTKIPTILLCTLQTLFVAKTKKCAIRDVLRDSGFIPEDEPITAQFLINLEMRLEKVGPELKEWAQPFMELPSKLDDAADMSVEDKVRFDRFAWDWVKDRMNVDNGGAVLKLLEENALLCRCLTRSRITAL
jgi:hypothetical protein